MVIYKKIIHTHLLLFLKFSYPTYILTWLLALVLCDITNGNIQQILKQYIRSDLFLSASQFHTQASLPKGSEPYMQGVRNIYICRVSECTPYPTCRASEYIRQLKSIWIWQERPSSKGSKLLFQVIKVKKINPGIISCIYDATKCDVQGDTF